MTDVEAQRIRDKYDWIDMNIRGYVCDNCPLRVDNTCLLIGHDIFGSIRTVLFCPTLESIQRNNKTVKGNKAHTL